MDWLSGWTFANPADFNFYPGRSGVVVSEIHVADPYFTARDIGVEVEFAGRVQSIYLAHNFSRELYLLAFSPNGSLQGGIYHFANSGPDPVYEPLPNDLVSTATWSLVVIYGSENGEGDGLRGWEVHLDGADSAYVLRGQ